MTNLLIWITFIALIALFIYLCKYAPQWLKDLDEEME